MGIWDIYELMVSLSHDLKGEHHQFWMVETCWNPTNHGINLPSIWVIHHYLIPIPSHPSWHPAQRWAAAPKTTDPAAPRLWSQRRRRRRRPEKSHGLINEISWTYCGYIMEISWTYYRYMMDILWLYYGDIMDILWTYHGHIVVILWRSHGHIVEIWWTYCG